MSLNFGIPVYIIFHFLKSDNLLMSFLRFLSTTNKDWNKLQKIQTCEGEMTNRTQLRKSSYRYLMDKTKETKWCEYTSISIDKESMA